MVVVTGAAGHVGGNLVRALLKKGRNVRVLVYRDRRALEGLDIEFVRGDIRDLESLKRVFKGAEVVYHAAVHISLLTSEWSIMEETNVIGTRNVVDACLECGVRRLIHFSSIHAIQQEPLNVTLDESHALVNSRQCPPYDRSKAAAENEVIKGIKKGLDAVILNPTGIIGPYDFKPSLCGEVLIALSRGKLPAIVKGGFDWVDVRDVVEGALNAEERARTGAKYILSGQWVSVSDMADTVQQIISVKAAARLVFPIWMALLGAPFVTNFARMRGKRPLYTSFSLRTLQSNRNISHSKATCELGYNPRPFKQTIIDTLKWFIENGNLNNEELVTIQV